TWAPAAASAFALSKPMPLVPPVTTMTRPSCAGMSARLQSGAGVPSADGRPALHAVVATRPSTSHSACQRRGRRGLRTCDVARSACRGGAAGKNGTLIGGFLHAAVVGDATVAMECMLDGAD